MNIPTPEELAALGPYPIWRDNVNTPAETELESQKAILKEINDSIAEMPQESRVRVDAIARILRAAINSDTQHGPLALALVGAEVSVQAGP